MKTEKLLAAGIGYDDGVRRFCGKAALYEKYLLQFPQDENYTRMAAALQSGDCETAFRCAHALKGVAGNLSLDGLFQQICPLVEALRSGRLQQAQALLGDVEQSYRSVLDAIASCAKS